MKLTTITLPSIEMTRQEENELWENWGDMSKRPLIEGKKPRLWNTSDGHNEIQLEGENFFRLVVIKG